MNASARASDRIPFGLIGQTLSHFQISAKLGKGGMGEVFLAEDTKLGREVAIKVLSEEFTADQQRLARFEREARVLAALNHPNIAAIYEVGDQRDVRFLVMELADGETLADRIARGPMPVDEAIRIALQIADAVEAAHGQGIVHRDLKPANVKVTRAGKVKVLDFGLAKAWEAGRPFGDGGATQSPTLTAQMTTAGVLLGTAAYMSPEQARGQEAGQQSDIWAFGAVLFEMLTGQRAFGGDTASDTLASVLKETPDLGSLPGDTTWKVSDLLQKCLEKDPRRRLHDIRDARLDLERTGEGPEPMIAGGQPKTVCRALFLVVGLVIGALVAWLVKPGSEPGRTDSSRPVRSHLTLPLDQTLLSGFVTAFDLSADGRKLIYAAKVDGSSHLWLRDLASFEAEMIPGTKGAVGPFLSPDGRSVGFYSQGKLVKVGFSSGAPLPVTSAGQDMGASWGSDGTIVLTDGSNLLRVPEGGGEVQVIATPGPEAGIIGYHRPSVLPGGRGILFLMERGLGPDPDDIGLLDLNTGEVTTIITGGGGHPRYVDSGHIVYGRSSGLLAVPFDLESMAIVGESVSVIRGGDGYQYAVSSTGTLVYRGSRARSSDHLVWVSRDGRVERISDTPGAYSIPALSPDGKQVALEVAGVGPQEVWIFDLERQTLTRLTFGGGSHPVWNPVENRIAYVATDRAIVWKPADGTGEAGTLFPGVSTISLPTSWSADGRRLYFQTYRSRNRMDIAVLDLDDPGEPTYLIESPFRDSGSVISPDGRWLAYVSNETGRLEVYVRPGDGSAGRWQISSSGGSEPRWSRQGNELYFRRGDEMMASAILAEDGFRAGASETLFELPMQRAAPNRTNYDVAADGRFLMVQGPSAEDVPESLRLVTNWHQELLTLAPPREQ